MYKLAAATQIFTLSLHDALPISMSCNEMVEAAFAKKYWTSNGKTPSQTIYAAVIREITKKGKDSRFKKTDRGQFEATDRKSTRLNSSHVSTSYAVFCLKKKMRLL